MKSVGATEARRIFRRLLERAGEGFTITRRWQIVARRLLPPVKPISTANAREAVARIKTRRRGVRLGGETIKGLIAEGRL